MTVPAAAVNEPTQSICTYASCSQVIRGNAFGDGSTTLKLGVLPTFPRVSAYSGSTVCMSSWPLVGCVHITRLSPVICNPQVLPPLDEYCSIFDPSGRNRTTPLPIFP